MKNYIFTLPAGSIVTSAEVKVFQENTIYEHESLLIHFIDNSVPDDCSPFRIMKIVLSAKEGFQGSKVTGYKDDVQHDLGYAPFDIVLQIAREMVEKYEKEALVK